MLRSDSLSLRKPGCTYEADSPEQPSSPVRKNFYNEFLTETDGISLQPSYQARNMVFANKKERNQERSVVSYMI